MSRNGSAKNRALSLRRRAFYRGGDQTPTRSSSPSPSERKLLLAVCPYGPLLPGARHESIGLVNIGDALGDLTPIVFRCVSIFRIPLLVLFCQPGELLPHQG